MNIGQRTRRFVVEPLSAPSAGVQPPDYAEPIVGWRLWLVVDRREGVRLASVLYDVDWPVGQPLEAGCIGRRRSGAARKETRVDMRPLTTNASAGSTRSGIRFR